MFTQYELQPQTLFSIFWPLMDLITLAPAPPPLILSRRPHATLAVNNH